MQVVHNYLGKICVFAKGFPTNVRSAISETIRNEMESIATNDWVGCMRLSTNKMVNIAIVVAIGAMLSIGIDRYISRDDFDNNREVKVVDFDKTIINAYDNSTVIVNQIIPDLDEGSHLYESYQSQVNTDVAENSNRVENSEAIMETAEADESEHNLLMQIMRMITKFFLIFCLGVGVLTLVIGVIAAVCKKL